MLRTTSSCLSLAKASRSNCWFSSKSNLFIILETDHRICHKQRKRLVQQQAEFIPTTGLPIYLHTTSDWSSLLKQIIITCTKCFCVHCSHIDIGETRMMIPSSPSSSDQLYDSWADPGVHPGVHTGPGQICQKVCGSKHLLRPCWWTLL